MRVLQLSLAAAVLSVALAAPSFAQATPPASSTGSAQAAPAGQPAQPPAPKPQPAVPFPSDAKYAFVDVQAVAANSAAGKAASARLQQLTESKQKEIGDKNKQLQALTSKRDTSVGVMNDAARAQLDKDIDKLQRDIQFANSNAQAEVGDLQNELQGDFQKKLMPIIEEVAKEKGLYVVFTAEAGVAFVHPGLNITPEVIKRFDTKK